MTTNDNLDGLLSEAISEAGPDLSDRMESDPDAYLELVRRTARAHDRTGDMVQAAVTAARGAGHSWEAIGKTLGMSRQAAQQRFGKDFTRPEENPGPERRRLPGLTAFNEMSALANAGRLGWHSIDYGPLFHIVERDDMQWEHRRVYAWSRQREELLEDGWRQVGEGWFPWAYFARPTDVPALEGEIS